MDRTGDCLIKYLEYQVKRDTCLFLAERTKIAVLVSIMLSSWLSVGILLGIAFTPYLGSLLFAPHPKPEVRQVEPTPAERPYETHRAPEVRTVT